MKNTKIVKREEKTLEGLEDIVRSMDNKIMDSDAFDGISIRIPPMLTGTIKPRSANNGWEYVDTSSHDKTIGDNMAHFVGDTFIECSNMSPTEQWTQIAKILRAHNVKFSLAPGVPTSDEMVAIQGILKTGLQNSIAEARSNTAALTAKLETLANILKKQKRIINLWIFLCAISWGSLGYLAYKYFFQ